MKPPVMPKKRLDVIDGDVHASGAESPRASLPEKHAEEKPAPRIWRSLDHLQNHDETKKWVESEFPFGLAPEEFGEVTRDGQEAKPGFIRREVLKLMGASMALAGVTGCVRRPEELILPYVDQPEHIIPGVPSYFATAFPSPNGAVGVLVESHEGRPTKIEGNPDHPASLGRIDRHQQAEILELYDPDRSREPMEGTVHSTWAKADEALGKALAASPDGSGLALLLDRAGGPTEARLLHALKKAKPKAQVFYYDPLAADRTVQGAEMVFGPGQRVHTDLSRADVIVAVDHDFTTEGANSVALQAGYAAGRSWDRVSNANESAGMNRLYVVEANFSTTGGNADHRLRVPRREIPAFMQALAVELFGKHGLTLPDALGGGAAAGKLASLRPTFKATNATFLPALAKDLASKKGRAVVTVGDAQPPAVHALAHLINAGLGAFQGEKPVATVSAPVPPAKDKVDAFFASRAEAEGGGGGGDAAAAPADAGWAFARPEPRVASAASLKALVDALNAGRVQTLIIIGAGNPAFASPGALGFKAALAKAKLSVHAGLRQDETGLATTWHLPLAHWLESWDDGVAWDGTVSVVQPLIQPLHGARPRLALLAAVAGVKGTPHELVKQTWIEDLGAVSGELAWRKALHRGSLDEKARRVVPLSAGEGADAYTAYITGHIGQVAQGAADKVLASLGELKTAAPSAQDLDVVFKADFKVADGRYANNGWLQELPDSMTKLCWDNAAIIGPSLSKALNIKSRVEKNSYAADEARITVGGQTVVMPVFVLPGVADNTVVLTLGNGRAAGGSIGTGVGIDTWPAVPADGSLSAPGKLERTGRSIELAGTQEHFALEQSDGTALQDIAHLNKEFQAKRPHAVTGTVTEYQQDHDFAKKGMLGAVAPGLVEPPERVQVTREKTGTAPTRPIRPVQPTYDVFDYEGQQWGMVIDLTACTACQACVIACQSENNIPIVGREQVLKGRELHWIRIDRYYVGDVDEPEGLHQPMNCLQCENAPCEPVCPVAATVHDTEGLNAMVYNRCIGTRYCANNCPVKVRRFNYFDFTNTAHFALTDEEKRRTQTLEMQRNPDVTVRFRGVMEKCTYCTQRIQEAKIAAKRAGGDGKHVKDGAITPACAQTCPTNAIVFGNINDPESRVAKMKLTDRNYEMLSELNIRPRTTYLARLKNKNPEIG